MVEQTSKQSETVQFQVGCSPVCDVVRKPKRRKRKSRPWHRVLGMLSALPLVWVMLTGVVLNHSDDFALDDKEVNAQWLLALYGMTPEGEPQSWQCHSNTVTEWDGQVFFNAKALELTGAMLGAVADSEDIVVVTSESVVRLDQAGEVIEKLDEISLPSLPLVGLSIGQEKVFLENAEGLHFPDSDWMEFQLDESRSAKPVVAQELEDISLKQGILKQWSGGGLPLSRVVLDLHAGNFLGVFAKYFYDFVVLCTLWLIGTGLVLQYRTSRRNKTKVV